MKRVDVVTSVSADAVVRVPVEHFEDRRRGGGRRRRILWDGSGNQLDLVDRQAVFARLDAHPLRAGGREVDGLGDGVRAVAVVLPLPAGEAAAAAVLEIHFGRRGRADAPLRRARGGDAARELHENRVVAPVVLVGLAEHAELIGHAGGGTERDLEIIGGTGPRGRDLGGALVGMTHRPLTAGRGTVRGDDPLAGARCRGFRGYVNQGLRRGRSGDEEQRCESRRSARRRQVNHAGKTHRASKYLWLRQHTLLFTSSVQSQQSAATDVQLI